MQIHKQDSENTNSRKGKGKGPVHLTKANMAEIMGKIK